MVEIPPVEGKPIAEARNQIVQQAFQSNCDFLFFLADDVLAPNDAIIKLLQRMWDHPEIHIITGVYWTKSWPTTPYIWRGIQRGPYLDWKVGEFFPIDFAGSDCLMIRLSPEIKALGPDWFTTNWVWEESQEKPDLALATEDFPFYTKARQAGLQAWCDTDVQCLHEDRETGILFGLTNDMPQAGGIEPALPKPRKGESSIIVADIGCGKDTPWFGPPDKVRIVRFDANEKVRPDYRCDIRHLPVPDQFADVVHAKHVLEHFGRAEVVSVLNEWLRILRVGGKLILAVPNLLKAIEWIKQMDAGECPLDPYPWWMLHGEQVDQRDIHLNSFTVRRVRLLLEATGILTDIKVELDASETSIVATAKKVKHQKPFAIVPTWDEIFERERLEPIGLKPKVVDLA